MNIYSEKKSVINGEEVVETTNVSSNLIESYLSFKNLLNQMIKDLRTFDTSISYEHEHIKNFENKVKLTSTEKVYLKTLCSNKKYSNKELAKKFSVSVKTVEAHKTHLASKFKEYLCVEDSHCSFDELLLKILHYENN